MKDRWITTKSILLRLLRPGTGWVLALIALSAAALVFIFTTGRDETAFGYTAYILSTYALAAGVVSLIPAARRMGAWALNLFGHNRFGVRCLTDLPFRARVSLHLSLIYNLTYAVFQLIAAILNASFWFGAVAVYYIVMCVGRFLLLMDVRRGEPDIGREYKKYRLCGIMLFVLSLALSAMVYQMINDGQGAKYPGLLIYPAAVYAFSRLTLSIAGALTYRKLNSPVLTASKIINVLAALVAMFSLQVAMFASFSNGAEFERVMNVISGGGVCLVCFGVAIYMVIRASRRLSAHTPPESVYTE